MRILITGINGFVGRHIARDFVQKGHTVYGIGRTKDLSFPTENATIRYCSVDIADHKALSEAVQALWPDTVIHLAAVSEVSACRADISSACDSNIKGTLHLLQTAASMDVPPHLIFVSSGQVYGHADTAHMPLTEDKPLSPENEYAFMKACGEAAVAFYCQQYSVPSTILRPFNHFGPFQKLGFIVPDVCHQIVRIEQGLQDPVVQVGNMDVSRDFLDIRDIVSAYRMASLLSPSGKTYNIASATPTSIRTLVTMLIGLSTVPIEVVSRAGKQRDRDLSCLYGDNSAFCQDTGWSPVYALEESLAYTLAYWRKSPHG